MTDLELDPALVDKAREAIHDYLTYQYDDCPNHGTHSGGSSHGEPYDFDKSLAIRVIEALGIAPALAHLAHDRNNSGLIVEWDGNEDHGDEPVLIQTYRIKALEPKSIRDALIGEAFA